MTSTAPQTSSQGTGPTTEEWSLNCCYCKPISLYRTLQSQPGTAMTKENFLNISFLTAVVILLKFAKAILLHRRKDTLRFPEPRKTLYIWKASYVYCTSRYLCRKRNFEKILHSLVVDGDENDAENYRETISRRLRARNSIRAVLVYIRRLYWCYQNDHTIVLMKKTLGTASATPIRKIRLSALPSCVVFVTQQ